VVGVFAMLLSSISRQRRELLLNPAAMKQVVAAGSSLLPGLSRFEQGAGMLDPFVAHTAVHEFAPHVSVQPPALDLTSDGCPALWPLCEQPLYATGQPLLVNVSVLNSRSVLSHFRSPPEWWPAENGHALEVSFNHEPELKLWGGFLGIRLRVHEAASEFDGTVAGDIVITLHDGPLHPPTANDTFGAKSAGELSAAARALHFGDLKKATANAAGPRGRMLQSLEPCPQDAALPSPCTVRLPLRVTVVKQPPRSQRLLFDIFHTASFPFGFFPNDDLDQLSLELMDWNGDHPHTAFVSLFRDLRREGYLIETLTGPWTSFNASLYAALLLIDPEEHFLPAEINKLQSDVARKGLGLAVVADWYDPALMKTLDYTDESTHTRRICGSGGANVPGLNTLLSRFGIAFSSKVYTGAYPLGGQSISHLSGTILSRFPAGGLVHHGVLRHVTNAHRPRESKERPARVPVFGMHRPRGSSNPGWIIAMGDSSCLDDALAHAKVTPRLQCRSTLIKMLNFAVGDNRAGRPAVFAHVQPLVVPIAEEEATAPLADNQEKTFRSQSRVWSMLRGCVTTNTSCTLPIVPPPVWTPAPPRTTARATSERWVSATERFHASAEMLFPLHVVAVPGIGALGLLTLLCCLPRGRKRPAAKRDAALP